MSISGTAKAEPHCALHYDLSQGHQPQIAALLLEHGDNPNAQNNHRRTRYIRYGLSLKLKTGARMLLEHGADFDAEDSSSRKTPLAAVFDWSAELTRSHGCCQCTLPSEHHKCCVTNRSNTPPGVWYGLGQFVLFLVSSASLCLVCFTVRAPGSE